MSPVSKITIPEQFGQFKLIEDPYLIKVNDLLINKTIPVTLYENFSIFCAADKEFESKGDFLEMIAKKNYNVDLGRLSEKKFLFEFAKERYSDEIALGIKCIRDRTLIRLLKSPAIMASGISSDFSIRKS